MFFFSTEIGLLMAIVIIGYLIVASVRKMGKNVGSSSNEPMQDIIVEKNVSEQGNAKVVKVVYHKPTGRYGAIVRSISTSREEMLVAKTETELKEKIDKVFEEYDKEIAG